MTASLAQRYAELFDNFVNANGLDLDDAYWPDSAKELWRETYAQFMSVSGQASEMKSAQVSAAKGASREVERALSRLAILPSPDRPELQDADKYINSPWPVVSAPAIDPSSWDSAELQAWDFEDLAATGLLLRRKRVAQYVEQFGQASTRSRSYALIAITPSGPVIIDGQHRLFALWLLGQSSAPAFTIETG